MKANAIVVYQGGNKKLELLEKRRANLVKARAARGTAITKIKKFNRSIVRIKKASVSAIISSTGAICSILGSIPHVLTFYAQDLKKWVRHEKRKRKKSR